MAPAAVTGSADPILRRELQGGLLPLVRAVTLTVVAVQLTVWIHLLPGIAASTIDQARSSAPADVATNSFEILAWAQVAVTVTSAAFWVAAAALVLWRRSRDLYGNLIVVSWVGFALLSDPTQVQAVRSDPWAPLPAIAFLTANAFVLPFGYTFPDGRFVPRWTILIAVFSALWSVARLASSEFDPSSLGLAAVVVFLSLYLGVLPAWIFRYARWANPVQREQIKWLSFGLVLFLAGWASDILIRYTFRSSFTGPAGFEIKFAAASLHGLAALGLVGAALIAIFRQGLLDIDLLINRTALYAIITAALAGVFVMVNALGQRVIAPFAGFPTEFVALVFAGLVAALVFSLRARLFAIADRFVPERRVLTFLFLDMTASTTKAADLGDRGWRELLNRFRAAVRGQLRRFGGREIDTAGDGFFAVFESPGQAIRCARRIVDEVRPLGVEVRVGLHVGECELQGGSVIGIGVVIAQRVMAAAPANEIFVSRTLRDLVAGSDIRFAERGTSILKGVPGEWQLYAVGAA